MADSLAQFARRQFDPSSKASPQNYDPCGKQTKGYKYYSIN